MHVSLVAFPCSVRQFVQGFKKKEEYNVFIPKYFWIQRGSTHVKYERPDRPMDILESTKGQMILEA